jgi:hypothetical protein
LRSKWAAGPAAAGRKPCYLWDRTLGARLVGHAHRREGSLPVRHSFSSWFLFSQLWRRRILAILCNRSRERAVSGDENTAFGCGTSSRRAGIRLRRAKEQITSRPQASSDRLRALPDLHPATARLRPSPYQTTFVPPDTPSQSHRIAAVRLHPRIQLAQSALSSRLPEGNFRCSLQDTDKRRAHPLANPQAGEE